MESIKSISIKGFKSISNLKDFELRPMNVLIGPNAAGKSNLLSFFNLLNWSFKSNPQLQLYVQTKGGANSILFDGANTTTEIVGQFVFEQPASNFEYLMQLDYASPDRLVYSQEKYRIITESRKSSGWIHFGAGHLESKLCEIDRAGDRDARLILKALRKMSMYQFHNTSFTSRMRQRWPRYDNNLLKEDGANIAPFLFKMKNKYPDYYNKIINTIRMIYPDFDEFVFDESRNILLQWREQGSDYIFASHQASDGTLRMFALVTLLSQPIQMLPNLLVIDEPELGLHPYAINIIGGLMKSVSVHKQILIATQSGAFADQFEVDDIIIVDKIDRTSIFSRKTKAELVNWLDKYSLSELWNANIIGGRP